MRDPRRERKRLGGVGQSRIRVSERPSEKSLARSRARVDNSLASRVTAVVARVVSDGVER